MLSRALSFIDSAGVANFVAGCNELARRHGKRFRPGRDLKARAAANRPFHPSPRDGQAA